MDAIRKPPMLE